MAEQTQSSYGDVPTDNGQKDIKATGLRRGLLDQIEQFNYGLGTGGSHSLQEASDAMEATVVTARDALGGDKVAQAKAHHFAECLIAGMSNPETYKKLVEAMGEDAAKLKIAFENDEYFDAGKILGVAMTEWVGPNKKRIVNQIEEIGEEALKDGAGDLVKGAGKKAIDTTHVGEFIPAGEQGKGIAQASEHFELQLPEHVASEEKNFLDKAKTAITHPYTTILDKISTPSPAERLGRIAHELGPTTLDNMNGQAGLLHDQHMLRTARAQQIILWINGSAELDIKPDPELGKKIAAMSDSDLQNLLNTDLNDAKLKIEVGPLQLERPSVVSRESVDGLINGFEPPIPGEVQGASAWQKLREHFFPQNPDPEKLDQFARELEQGNLGNAVISQMKSVHKGWLALGGTAITAATLVTHHMESEQEDALAKLPPNERLAALFNRTAGNPQLEKETIEKNPEDATTLRRSYQTYHKIVEDAHLRYPGAEGHASSEAASAIYLGKKALTETIRNGREPDKNDQRSSADGMTPVEVAKVTFENIKKMPPDQQGPHLQEFAEFLKREGIAVTVTQTQEVQHEQGPQQA